MISVEHMDELIQRFNSGELDIRDIIEQSYFAGEEDACREAIKALEKQIPKRMNPNFNCIYCDCGNPIYYQTDRLLHHYNYCCECGQAIKWE